MDSGATIDNGLPQERKLGEIYAEALSTYNEWEKYCGAMNSTEVQVKIKKNINLFEDATKLVSLNGIFSSNETYDEVPTENLKYFLLPFYLGRLTTRLCSSDRKNLVEVSEVYFKDFLKRCEDYDLCSTNEEACQAIYELTNYIQNASDLAEIARQRDSKIEQYKRKKELDEQIKQLSELIERESVDDDVKRDFHIKVLKSSILEANDELQSIADEKEILEYMSKRVDAGDNKKPTKHPNPPPLRPVIITKDAVQKAVFGLGYPSIPTMTVSEFYDERVREGIFPDPSKALQDVQPGDMLTDAREEEEKIKNETGEENDDPEYLARARAMDEFRDDVRRGDGNRQNRS